MGKDLMIQRNVPNGIWNTSDFDEIFERAFRNPLSLLDELRATPMMNREWFEPRVDLEESEQALLLSVDLPGLKKEEVKVDLSSNVLTISGERKREEEHKERNGIRRFERSYGKFQRSFALPETIDADKVEASMEDGVLRIALPKLATAKSRAIQVQSGKGGLFAKLIGRNSEEKSDSDQKKAH